MLCIATINTEWVRSGVQNGVLVGPCKGGGGPGILDSNFKQTRDSGFKFQKGQDFKMAWIQDSNFK